MAAKFSSSAKRGHEENSKMTARKPNLLWAQRTGTIYLTIDLQEAEKPQVNVENESEGHGHVIFKGRAKSHATGNESHLYELDQELYGPVDPDKSKISVMPRHIVLVIAKQADKEGYWPRLCKESTRQPNLQVDWDKWVDEDEEQDAGLDPSSQFDLSSLSDFSNFNVGESSSAAGAAGGENAIDEDSDDDEDLPDLEPPKPE